MNDDVKRATSQLLQLETRTDEALAHPASDLRPEGLFLLQAAVEHAADSFIITAAEIDPPGPTIVFVNPAFTRMTGYAADEAIGRTPRFLAGPVTSRSVLDRLDACLAAGEQFHGEAVNYRKDGVMLDVEWRMDPIRNEAGKITHWVAILRDLTENRSLERAVREQQVELQRTLMLRMLAQIAEDTIHDSLQPLYAVGNLGAACRNAIIRQGREAESKKILQWLQSILDAVNHAKSSVTGLRSVARSSEPRRQTLTMDEVIEPLLDSLAHEFERDGVSLDTQLECRSPVDVDSAQIRYILAQLVQNASEAIQNSVAVTGNISLRSWSQDDLCHVVVEDDGPGVECVALADIFTPFYTTKTDQLGLSLAFCRAIVKAHGGDIFAERVETGGSHVEFIIPAAQAPTDD